MSFQEKSIWISFITTVLVFGYYFIQAFRILNAYPAVYPLALTGLLIGAVVWIIMIEVILHVILAIVYRKEAKAGADERDHLIELKGTRNAHFLLITGVVITVMSTFINPSLAIVVSELVFFFILSEAFGFASQLFYYRRGM